MKLQFELTDTFGREANYSWVKRETIQVPDGTPDKLTIALAREWAGWGVRSEIDRFNDSADTIALRPRGRCEVLFITTVYEPPEEGTWANPVKGIVGDAMKAGS
jgi:hypothetical protein